MTTTSQGACPVSGSAADLVKTFHVFDAGPTGDIYEAFRTLQQGCPVGRSELFDGYWVITRHADMVEILRDAQTFSSRFVTVPPHEDPLGRSIPHQQDPPDHTAYRHDLQRIFSPTAANSIEAETRERARSIMQTIVKRGRSDFAAEFADPFPGITFLLMLGLPVNSLPSLTYWKYAMVQEGMGPDPDKRAFAAEVVRPTVDAFFQCALDQRRRLGDDAPDDVLTALTRAKFGDRTWTDDEVQRCIHLLMNAGLDTVAGVLGLSFHFLATHPEHRQSLIDDPSLIPGAVEEFLRYFSNVSTARVATRDTEVGGHQIKAGDLVLLPTPAAGRDAEAFDNADEVDFARQHNRHLGFGGGPHRCLGSHIARMELRIALQEMVEIMPHFEIDASAPAPVFRYGLIFGMESLPLVIR